MELFFYKLGKVSFFPPMIMVSHPSPRASRCRRQNHVIISVSAILNARKRVWKEIKHVLTHNMKINNIYVCISPFVWHICAWCCQENENIWNYFSFIVSASGKVNCVSDPLCLVKSQLVKASLLHSQALCLKIHNWLRCRPSHVAANARG